MKFLFLYVDVIKTNQSIEKKMIYIWMRSPKDQLTLQINNTRKIKHSANTKKDRYLYHLHCLVYILIHRPLLQWFLLHYCRPFAAVVSSLKDKADVFAQQFAANSTLDDNGHSPPDFPPTNTYLHQADLS